MGPTLKRILKWILILLLLIIALAYLFYKINPRKYGYPFIILAHIVPDPPGHKDCVPNVNVDSRDPDFNDSWANPQSRHLKQHYEWLGKCVTQEGQPVAADQYDDGLGGITFYKGQEWVQGSEFTLKVIVSTTQQHHPDAFERWGTVAVYSYIDWNLNSTFEQNELMHSWTGLPPFATPADPDNIVFETTKIIVPAAYQRQGSAPPIRLRLTWEWDGIAHPAPGGLNNYGETEDYDWSREEMQP